LDTVQGRDRFQDMIRHLCGLYDLKPDQVDAIACDAHPDYSSTQLAQIADRWIPAAPSFIPVQHHYAHVLAGMADNQWQPPVLGLAWDGTGYGLDGTIWGGEVLWIPDKGAPSEGFRAVAHVKPFPFRGVIAPLKNPAAQPWDYATAAGGGLGLRADTPFVHSKPSRPKRMAADAANAKSRDQYPTHL
jgi:hydrogenase maturation protein HypF